MIIGFDQGAPGGDRTVVAVMEIDASGFATIVDIIELRNSLIGVRASQMPARPRALAAAPSHQPPAPTAPAPPPAPKAWE